MATIKGENLRILVGPDAQHLKCIAASTSCQIHLSLQVEEDSTKDTDNDWIENVPVGINWDVQVDALVIDDADAGAVDAIALQPGAEYVLRFSQTAGAAGEMNRDAVSNRLQLTGKAILSDLTYNAPNQEMSTASAKFTGSADLVQYSV